MTPDWLDRTPEATPERLLHPPRAAQALLRGQLEKLPEIRHLKIEDGPGRRLGRSYRVKRWPTLILLRDGVAAGSLDQSPVGALVGDDGANQHARPVVQEQRTQPARLMPKWIVASTLPCSRKMHRTQPHSRRQRLRNAVEARVVIVRIKENRLNALAITTRAVEQQLERARAEESQAREAERRSGEKSERLNALSHALLPE